MDFFRLLIDFSRLMIDFWRFICYTCQKGIHTKELCELCFYITAQAIAGQMSTI